MDQTQEWLQKAKDYMNNQMFDAANECIDIVIEMDPKQIDAIFMKSSLLIINQKYQEANELLKSIVDINKDLNAINLLAENYAILKDYENAIKYYEISIAEKPVANILLSYASLLLDHIGDIDKGIEILNKLLVNYPQNTEALMMRGLLLLQINSTDEGMNDLKKLISITPGSAEAWYGIGIGHRARGQYKDAIECADKALDINHELSLAYYLKSMSYLDTGEFDMAIDNARQTLKYDPGNYGAQLVIALSLNNMQKYPEALAEISDLLAIYTSDPSIWATKADILLRMKRNEEAIQCLADCLKYHPMNDIIWMRKANLHNEFLQFKNALYCFDKVISFDSKNMDAYNGKLLALAGLEDFDGIKSVANEMLMMEPDNESAKQAIEIVDKKISGADNNELFDELLERDPDNMELMLIKAKTLLTEDKFTDALTIIDRILLIDANNMDVLTLKGYAFDKLHEFSRAERVYDQMIAINSMDHRSYAGKILIASAIGIPQEVLELSERMLQLDPNMAIAMSYHASATEVINNLLKKPNLSPEEAVELVKQLLDNGKFSEAILILDLVLLENSELSMVWYLKAIIFERAQMPRHAIYCLERILKFTPENQEIINFMDQLKDNRVI